MKAGLFQCDHVDDKYRTRFGDYSDMFVQLLPDLDWTFYDACNGIFPSDLDECEVYFATGSYRSVYEDIAWIKQLKQVVRAIAAMDKYFVGCCFGHQLLGEAMGGSVQKSQKGWCVSVHEFEVIEKKHWQQPFQAQINLLMMCQDQIIELPPNATIIAGNEQCPVGIMQISEKLLGIQGHPEFSKAYDQVLLEMRINKMGEAVVSEGLERLAKPVHRETIRNWIMRFISGGVIS
ncbi:MAG: amidotransferase [Bacteroidota bacterium]